MKNHKKALEAIESLVGGGFGLDMECLLYMPKRKLKAKECRNQLETAAKIITEIYCISHAENATTCRHEDWEQKKYEILMRGELYIPLQKNK